MLWLTEGIPHLILDLIFSVLNSPIEWFFWGAYHEPPLGPANRRPLPLAGVCACFILPFPGSLPTTAEWYTGGGNGIGHKVPNKHCPSPPHFTVCVLHLNAHNAPNVIGRQENEDEADKQDGRTCPLKLSVLAIFKIGQGKLDEEGDSHNHAQGGKDHIVHYGLDLSGGVFPGLFHCSRHIAVRRKRRNRANQDQQKEHNHRPQIGYALISSATWQSLLRASPIPREESRSMQ